MKFLKFMHLFMLINLLVFTSTSQAKSLDLDPCKNLSGNWTGTWTHWSGGFDYFRWNAEVKAEENDNNVKLQMTFSKSLPRSTETFTGVCKNGELHLRSLTYPINIEGNIFGDQISLKNEAINVMLKKA